jgi:hypothetical protein
VADIEFAVTAFAVTEVALESAVPAKSRPAAQVKRPVVRSWPVTVAVPPAGVRTPDDDRVEPWRLSVPDEAVTLWV